MDFRQGQPAVVPATVRGRIRVDELFRGLEDIGADDDLAKEWLEMHDHRT